MKRIFILLFVAALMLPFGVSAADGAGLFTYDQADLDNNMAQLDELEAHVLLNEGITLNSLKSDGNALVSNMNASPNNLAFVQSGPLGIPSILWGFCFSIPGMIIVYLVTDSREETIKSLWGCIISSLLFGGGYGIWGL